MHRTEPYAIKLRERFCSNPLKLGCALRRLWIEGDMLQVPWVKADTRRGKLEWNENEMAVCMVHRQVEIIDNEWWWISCLFRPIQHGNVDRDPFEVLSCSFKRTFHRPVDGRRERGHYSIGHARGIGFQNSDGIGSSTSNRYNWGLLWQNWVTGFLHEICVQATRTCRRKRNRWPQFFSSVIAGGSQLIHGGTNWPLSSANPSSAYGVKACWWNRRLRLVVTGNYLDLTNWLALRCPNPQRKNSGDYNYGEAYLISNS